MKYGSLSKSKYTSNNINSMTKTFKPKEINLKMKSSNTNTLVVDKDVKGNILTSFRPSALNGVTINKFRTSKNSPERTREQNLEQRNFSGERKTQLDSGKLMMQNYLNSNAMKNNKASNTNSILNSSNNGHQSSNTPNKKLKQIIEEGNGIENLMKQKILKKKEKIKTNILNFSNPYSGYNNKFAPGYFKVHLETSAQNHTQGQHYNLKKEMEIGRYDDRSDKMRINSGNKSNNGNYSHKRCNSTYEEEEIHSHRQEIRQEGKKSLMSPRIDNILNKYYEGKKDSSISHSNSNTGGNSQNTNTHHLSSSVDWKKNSLGSVQQGKINVSTSVNISNMNKLNNEYILSQKGDMDTLTYKYNNQNKKMSTSSTKQATMSGSNSNFTSTQKSINFGGGGNNGMNSAEFRIGSNNANSKHQTIGNKSNIHHYNHAHNLHKEKIDLSQITHRDTSQISLKQSISKTSAGTKNNSRKNSMEKTLFKNSKNLFLAANKNTLKASTNTSTNSSSTLLSNNQNQNHKYSNLNNINAEMERENNFNLNFNHFNNINSIIATEQSQTNMKKTLSNPSKTGGFHNKGLSEIPVLSSMNMNILNNPKNTVVSSSILANNLSKNFLYNNNLKYYNNNMKNTKSSSVNSSSNNGPSGVSGSGISGSGLSNPQNKKKEDESLLLDKSLKKKFGPVPIPITTIQSKSNSKNNSKSVSRIEDVFDTPYANLYLKQNNQNMIINPNKPKGGKSNSLTKKYIPITTSHSPTNMLAKDFVGFGGNKKESGPASAHGPNDKNTGGNMNNKNSTPNTGSAQPLVNSEKQPKEKIAMKINLDINNLKKADKGKSSGNTAGGNNNQKEDFDKKNTLEAMLDNSSDSIRSTMRESNYYRRESEKVSNYIRQHYQTYGEYPKTISKFYKFGRLLGRGAFGKVNLALHIATGRLVAIKSFNKNKLTSENAKRKILHETNILKNMKHHSVVKIYETFETSKYILIVMEYVSCGDLLSFVRKRSKLNENTAKFIFKQIIEALQYIHSQNIVHRDIKLDNILIDLQNNIKVCDFGVSRQVRKGDVMHDQCGTPAYIAPEILRNQGYEGFSVDIWSSGVVLYAMLSGTVPFKANNMNDLHKLIMKGNFQYIKDISEDAHNLIVSILEVDPKKRVTIDQILNHPWIKSIDKTKSKMNLFTAAEKILLAKSNLDYRYANRDEIIENFTIRNLDTQQETENQNINTKSIILAPFNSSIKPNDSFMHKDLNIANEVLKFCGKVKELNRNYELNNNEEIDNGIIISPQNEGNNSKNNTITPIYSPYAPSPFHNSFNNNLNNANKIISKPISPAEFEDNHANNKVSGLNSPKEESIQKNFIKNGNNLHSINNQFAIDEKIVKEVEQIGYRKEYIIKSLLNNEINYATAAYYLLLNNSRDY